MVPPLPFDQSDQLRPAAVPCVFPECCVPPDGTVVGQLTELDAEPDPVLDAELDPELERLALVLDPVLPLLDIATVVDIVVTPPSLNMLVPVTTLVLATMVELPLPSLLDVTGLPHWPEAPPFAPQAETMRLVANAVSPELRTMCASTLRRGRFGSQQSSSSIDRTMETLAPKLQVDIQRVGSI